MIYVPLGGIRGATWEQAKSSLQTVIMFSVISHCRLRKTSGTNMLYRNILYKILEGTASQVEYEKYIKAMSVLLNKKKRPQTRGAYRLI